MYCKKCGAVVTGKFCSNCGTRAKTLLEEYRAAERKARRDFINDHVKKNYSNSGCALGHLADACWNACTTPSYSFDTDNNGNAFKVKNFLVLIDAWPIGGSAYLEIKPNKNFSFAQKPKGKQDYPFSFMMKRLTDKRYILENSTTSNLTFERKISNEYSSFGEFTSFSFWFSANPASDTTMYILGEDA